MKNDLETNYSGSEKSVVVSRSQKLQTTASILFTSFCLGSVLNCYGPAIKDFETKYESDVDTISKVFIVITIGYLVGALLTGFIFNFLNRQLGVVIVILGMLGSMYLTPHAPTLTLFYCVGGLIGFSGGVFASSQIVWMIEIWQHESGPFIQTQHFFYALGSLVPPLILAPFLTTGSESGESYNAIEQESKSSLSAKPSRNPNMYIPFTILGAFCTIAFFWQLYLFVFKRYYPPPPEEDRNPDTESSEFDEAINFNKKASTSLTQSQLAFIPSASKLYSRRLKLITLSAIFLGSYQGMEMCTMQFLPTFIQEGGLEITESEGAYIMSALSGALTFGRFLGIFAIFKIRPQFILLFTITLITCANVILLLFANSSLTILWIGTIMIGLGFSTTYPSFCVYIERHLLFTNSVGAIMLIVGSGVASIYPLVIGKYVGDDNRVLTYVNFFSLFWMVVAGALIYKMTYKHSKI